MNSSLLYNQTGDLPVSLVNDYFFRILFERNETALKGFLSALLRIQPDEIEDAKIINPIKPGMVLTDKEFHLDLLVKMKGQHVNIEMQVVDYHNWNDRSLAYLCRQFDNLNKGDDYACVTPVIHISLLDFTLFETEPEFYATYKMLNVKKPAQIYNSKFVLSVLELNQIDLATEEDKEWNLDLWARFFKEKTWEGLRMLAEQSKYLASAADTAACIVMDPEEERQMRYRQEMAAYKKMDEKLRTEMQEQLTDTIEKLAEAKEEITAKDQQLTAKDQQLAETKEELTEVKKELATMAEEIKRLKAQIKD
ncbi:MAG: Rpn family recombination-promoting nuclease/putative transposase [Pseudobutyrivibrio sp.]|nr:Rpn family recombination-promoting nuclease/putative transposase [Pseudobutyrivibrio sp.]